MSTLVALIRAEPSRPAPVVPQSWAVQVEDNGWTTLYPRSRGGVFVHARLIFRQQAQPTRAVFVVTGAAAVLQRLADAIAADGLAWTQTWSTLGALRVDAGAVATAVRAAWPDDRPRPIVSGTPGDPLNPPVFGAPVGARVALRARMAGYGSEDAET